MLGVILLITLLLEVVVLTYIEYAAWKTIYTPLCCLMLPYFMVLLITICISGHLHFVDFNYESLFVWNIGLIIFAIPSYVLSLYAAKYPKSFHTTIDENKYPKILGVLAIMLALAFLYRFLQVLKTSIFLFGTDDFAEEFSGHGIWAHLREVVMPLLIITLFYVKKKSWALWGIALLLLTIQFLYMVKGAIIIAVVSAMCMRLYAGKMHLNIKLLAYTFGGGFAVFILTYMVIPLLGNEDGEANMKLFEFVSEHFLHYFTSGTFGYSYDIDWGMPDKGDFEILVSPFVNIFKTLTGDSKLLSPVNPIYLHTGINYTNVRTFFGTMDVYCNWWQFTLYTLIASMSMYCLKLWASYTGNLFAFVIVAYFCGLMAMGWFEFYLFHLSIIEIPLITGVLMLLVKLENHLMHSSL